MSLDDPRTTMAAETRGMRGSERDGEQATSKAMTQE